MSGERLDGNSTHQSSYIEDLRPLPDVSASSHGGSGKGNTECGHKLLGFEAEDVVYGADFGELRGKDKKQGPQAQGLD